jgi:hypothetical protein
MMRHGDVQDAMKLQEDAPKEYPLKGVTRQFYTGVRRAMLALTQSGRMDKVKMLEEAFPTVKKDFGSEQDKQHPLAGRFSENPNKWTEEQKYRVELAIRANRRRNISAQNQKNAGRVIPRCGRGRATEE